MYGYEWTGENGIFRLTIAAKIQKEIRPVFHEELDFFGMDKYWDYPKDTDAPLLWAEGIRQYILNGECVAVAQGGSFYSKPEIQLKTDERLQLKPIDVDRLYEVNKRLIKSLESKALDFIQEQYDIYSKRSYSFICAFSGGKDSLLLLDLVSKRLDPKKFYVVFSNTGMELSDTLKSVERAKKHWCNLQFEEARCHMDPCESWDEFGPPGRRMRWCCTVHKSTPTILKLREITKSYNAKAVVYDGVRAEESARRAKYDEVSEGAKNISQVNVSPIHKWNTAELYCYLLHERILFNDAYRIGLFRVGCMVCPLSSEWWEGIANNYYAEEMKPLVSKVERYAQNAKVKSEVIKYIENGGWKARMGGKGLDNGGNKIRENIEDNKLKITIIQPKQQWVDVAEILGVFVDSSGNSYTQKIGSQRYECYVRQDDNAFTVSYYPFSQMDRFVISHIRGVANKVAYCIGCKACEVQCPTGAFSIQSDGKILIREDRCVHCYNCLSFTEKSCLCAKSLSITGGSSMDLRGMNPYQHFGLRQPWLEHYMDEGVKCFSMNKLGNLQYVGLKAWLKESCLLSVEKGNNLCETELYYKLKKYGSFNPFVWAIIWANLCYNSTICHWYCLNAELGATYEKGDLVVMLGENYSKSNRDNAITALTETLRFSPVGDALQQGLPLELTKNSYSYLREGWKYPNAVALLYSLYLYAEHTGNRRFTFSDLVNAHSKPNANGVSPHDIYGIDVKSFRENVQGLAITFPDYIRVTFIANLDNIILEDYKSIDILDLEED